MRKKKIYKWFSVICFSLCIGILSLIFLTSHKDMVLILLNSESVNSQDINAINSYFSKFNSKIIDVKGYKDAAGIYAMLKSKYSHFYDKIKGIQIFGTKSDVPAFKCKFKCQMVTTDDIDTCYGTFDTDFCYSNFSANTEELKNPIKIYDIEKNHTEFDFKPHWQVARVMLRLGQIAKYIQKHEKFYSQYNPQKLPINVFSCSVLDEKGSADDDMCYFIKRRLDKEFSLLNTKYKLYGTKEGECPIIDSDDGDFSIYNITKENQLKPCNFIISTHGRKRKIMKSIKQPDKSEGHLYKFLTIKNVNKELKYNYYTLNTWSCYLAKDMDKDNFIYKAMKGKCIDAIAATNILSNNGSKNSVSLSDLEKNNPFYFHYIFFKNLAENKSRSESFINAKIAYAESILNHKEMKNYQYNLHNILSLHYFGLIR